ncbi:MAG: hypothetical protein ABSA52_21090 [Candidatus Binatia bacterium]
MLTRAELVRFNMDGLPDDADFRELRQFLVWEPRFRPEKDKPDKVPISAQTAHPTDVTDPAALVDLDTAARYADEHQLGLGFAFLADDPFCGVDLDACRDPATGVVEPWAQAIVTLLDSYSEVSATGTGVHIIVRGRVPGPRCRSGKIEIYDRARFFALTGVPLA